jgi:5-methyltetrahydrofolate--homocysteine methyltransferase
MMGTSASEMAKVIVDAGADIIGTNCSLGSGEMVDVVKELCAAAPDVPILVHPNAGRPIQNDDGTITYPETPEMMAANVPALIEAGANIIGGCCGTGPDHIRAIGAAVKQALAAQGD